MAGYTNEQLNTIYSLLGFNFYLDFDPNIKSMIIATQAVADGGVQPDGTLQARVLFIADRCTGNLGNTNSIDQQLFNLTNLDWITQSSTGAKIDPARGDFLLRRQGRALIKQLTIIMALKGVRSNYYGTAKHHYEVGQGISYFPNDDF